MAAGTNGSYGDYDTPVRNTAHWLVSFCLASRLLGDAELRRAAERALSYLLACCAHFPGSVIMRHAKGKDRSNGVLGPAHIVEALFYAWKVLDRSDARDAALTLIGRHPFDPQYRCWKRITPRGKATTIDDTFNHQLYYSAAIGLFAREVPAARAEVEAFCAGLGYSFAVSPEGRIRHAIPMQRGVKGWLQAALSSARGGNKAMAAKEANYHSYNLYAFSLLAGSGVDIPLLGTPQWSAAERFADSAPVRSRLALENCADGLPSGTETAACDVAFFRQTFQPDIVPDIDLALRQLDYIGGPDRQCSLLSPDPATQRARIYRYWRLLPVDRESRGVSTVMGSN